MKNFLLRMTIVTGLIIACLIGVSGQLPVDSEGWTEITSSPDTRTIYVSSSLGDDANNGLTPETAVATAQRAISLVRKGYPDHILFKRGDEWPYSFKNSFGYFKSGRSANEPMVISVYGESGARPVLKAGSFFNLNSDGILNHVHVQGIEFYNPKSDPDSDEYNFSGRCEALRFIGVSENILLEDCLIRFIQISVTKGSIEGHPKNFKMRRCMVLDSYGNNSYTLHELNNRAQGIFIADTEGVLIEECLFDHNGWSEVVEGAGANMFNHNIYMSGGNPHPSKIIIRGNILARAAAHGIQLRSGGLCENNLFLNNSIGINTGYEYVDNYAHMLDYVDEIMDSKVSDNVFLYTRYQDEDNYEYPRTGALIGISESAIPLLVSNNIIGHSINLGGKAIGTYNDINEIGGELQLIDNIIYKFYTSNNSSPNETQDPGWLDPERNVGSYNQHLNGTSQWKDFLTEARKRPLQTWWPEYAADSVNSYMRSGFVTGEDHTSPAVPENLTEVWVTDVAASVTWDWALDNVRTAGYNFYVDGDKKNEELIQMTQYEFQGLDASSDHLLTVTALDLSGNESDPSDAFVIHTLSPDTEAPSIPQNLEVTDTSGTSIGIRWTASTDNYGIWAYRIYLDGEQVKSERVVKTSYAIEGLTNAVEYSIRVVAVDGAGNESDMGNEIILRTLDTEAPDLPSNLLLGPVSSSTIRITWDSSSDNLGVAGYYAYLDGVLHGISTDPSYQFTGLAENQSYQIAVAAFDDAGNLSRRTQPISVETYTTTAHLEVSEEIHIYPNPVGDGIIFIEMGDRPSAHVAILDISGKIVHQASCQGPFARLDVSSLSSGFYLVQIIVSQEDELLYTRLIYVINQ